MGWGVGGFPAEERKFLVTAVGVAWQGSPEEHPQ